MKKKYGGLMPKKPPLISKVIRMYPTTMLIPETHLYSHTGCENLGRVSWPIKVRGFCSSFCNCVLLGCYSGLVTFYAYNNNLT